MFFVLASMSHQSGHLSLPKLLYFHFQFATMISFLFVSTVISIKHIKDSRSQTASCLIIYRAYILLERILSSCYTESTFSHIGFWFWLHAILSLLSLIYNFVVLLFWVYFFLYRIMSSCYLESTFSQRGFCFILYWVHFLSHRSQVSEWNCFMLY